MRTERLLRLTNDQELHGSLELSSYARTPPHITERGPDTDSTAAIRFSIVESIEL